MKQLMAWNLKASVMTAGLVLGLAAGSATAQSYASYDGQADDGRYGQPSVDPYGRETGVQYDFARVLRVDPVIMSGSGRYAASDYRNCNDVSGSSQGGYAGNGGYYDNDAYRNDPYRNDPYRNDPYRSDGYYGGDNVGYYGDQGYGNQDYGHNTGRAVATMIGGVLGAAIGSKVGGGSARYATSALGSLVGSVAGRQIYESSQQRQGTVRACDPVTMGRGDSAYYDGDVPAVSAYDVTYEYAGRTYATRTNYNPGNQIRVRVDVRPE